MIPFMERMYQFYSRAQTLRGGYGALPMWARYVILIFAMPGITIAILSLIGFMISIVALLLLVVPVYRALQAVAGGTGSDDRFISIPSDDPSPGAKPVEARIVE